MKQRTVIFLGSFLFMPSLFGAQAPTSKTKKAILPQPKPVVQKKEHSALNSAILKTYDTDPIKDNQKRYEAVLNLLNKKPVVDTINRGDGFGDIALHLAAERGYTDIVRLMMQKVKPDPLNVKNPKGLNINVNDKAGDTALIIAVKKGNKEIVELLVNAGARINKQIESSGNTALDFATDEQIKSFLKSKGGKTGKELAAEKE